MAAPREKSVPKFLGISVIGGGLAAVALGWLYGWMTAANPFIYLNIIGVFVLGGAVGLAIHAATETAGVAGGGLVTLVALVLSGLAVYVSYAVWADIVFQVPPDIVGPKGQSLHINFWNPSNIIDWMKIAAREGLWSIGAIEPRGIFLWGIWGAEVLGIVATAVGIANNGLPEGE